MKWNNNVNTVEDVRERIIYVLREEYKLSRTNMNDRAKGKILGLKLALICLGMDHEKIKQICKECEEGCQLN